MCLLWRVRVVDNANTWSALEICSMDWTSVLHTLSSDYSHGLCIWPWVVFLWNVAKAQQRPETCSVPRSEQAFGSHPSTLWYLDEPRGALWFYIRWTLQAPGHQVSASSGYMKEGLWICGNIPPQRPTNELAFPLTQRRPWLGAHRDSYISFDPFCGTDWLDCAEFTVCSGTGGWIG